MKKALVMTLIMVLAVAGIASAEAKLGGSFKVEYVVDTDKDNAGKGSAEAPLTLTVTAEEEGVWSVSADLEADAADGDTTVEVGDWSMNLTDDLFVADLWGGGVEKDGIGTPLDFVATEDDVAAGPEGAHLRVTSDVLGYVDLTLDYDPDELFVFASKALNDITVGGAIQKDLTTEGVLAAVHGEYVFGAATLTGEVGMDTAEEDENFMGGGKVSYKLNDQITLKGKATYKAKNIVKDYGELLLEAGADYVEDLFKVTGTVTMTDDLDYDDTKATYKIKANVTYRTNEDVAFGDLFDDYDTLTGYAAFAEAAYTTAKDFGDDLEPVMEATLKGAGVAVPDMVWVYGELKYKSDEDTFKDDFKFIDEPTPDATVKVPLKVENYLKLKAEGTVRLTDKVKVIPAIKYGQWTTVKANVADDAKEEVKNYAAFTAEDQNELDLSAAMTYDLSDSSEVGVSYTYRTQKFTEASIEQLDDSFAKVYFKTSF
ncbi:MAG: hypothetical protein GX977_05595 [Firmicutes bacterium]|nr:hypothetical protein [Bacillota bacterium]